MTITCDAFGTLADGRKAKLYTLKNASGACVSVSDYGATLVKCVVPDRNGVLGDVALGFESAACYEKDVGYIGGLCGRYANRIAAGELCIGDKTYALPVNSGKHHLHGGTPGFSNRIWEAETEEDSVVFSLLSPDGDNNYPGTVRVTVKYTWSEENRLTVCYYAETDAPTVINLTLHAYWNMDGADGRTARNNLLRLYASRYTPITADVIPDGRILPADGPLDFTSEKPISEGLRGESGQLLFGGGFDINYVLDKNETGLAAELTGTESGRKMQIYTTEPGIQLYTGNFLGGYTGKYGAAYTPGTGIALETQHFPDTPHHSDWPSVSLLPGTPFTSKTEFRFTAL